jgi:hypothetical protein
VLAASLVLAEGLAGQGTISADHLAVDADATMVATSFDRVGGYGAKSKSEMLSQREFASNK